MNSREKLLAAYRNNIQFKESIDDMIGMGNVKYQSGEDFINDADEEGLNILKEHLFVLEGY